MSSLSGRSNSNERGSSYDRRTRRAWLVSTAAGFGGDGIKAPCWECGIMLTADEVYADRIVTGEDGGTYRRSNIKGPHCCSCSGRQGQRRTVAINAARYATARAGTDHWHDDEGRYAGPLPCRMMSPTLPPIEACEGVPDWALIGY